MADVVFFIAFLVAIVIIGILAMRIAVLNYRKETSDGTISKLQTQNKKLEKELKELTDSADNVKNACLAYRELNDFQNQVARKFIKSLSEKLDQKYSVGYSRDMLISLKDYSKTSKRFGDYKADYQGEQDYLVDSAPKKPAPPPTKYTSTFGGFKSSSNRSASSFRSKSEGSSSSSRSKSYSNDYHDYTPYYTSHNSGNDDSSSYSSHSSSSSSSSSHSNHDSGSSDSGGGGSCD